MAGSLHWTSLCIALSLGAGGAGTARALQPGSSTGEDTPSSSSPGSRQAARASQPARKLPGRSARLVPSASWHARRGPFFQRAWGVDITGVRPVASGLMLRLDYTVLDPVKAAPLTDRKARAYLIDEATRTALAVPAMENIGELRQVGEPQARRTYYMLFGNPGRLVKSGSRVTIVVGSLRAEGVVVD